jgi:hypothetical protein
MPRRPDRAGHRPGAPGAGQGAELQQLQRCRRRARAGQRIPRRPADGGDRQARQSVRRRHGRHAWRKPMRRPSPATPCRRSAASSRSTARWTRHGRADRRHLHRSRRRPRCRRSRARAVRRQEEPPPAADRRAARSGTPRADGGKSITGGWLVQSRDNGIVAGRSQGRDQAPADRAELADCLFAWTVAKHVKSNAIVYAKDGSTAGVGAGQMNRLESARIAAWKAKDAAEKAGWASRARSVRPSPRTPSSPSPTGCWRRWRPARPQ